MNRIHGGKVRDVYDAGGDRLLMVASDRISAFDVILPEPVPDKGRVLTAMTAFWDEAIKGIAPTHLITVDPAKLPPGASEVGDVAGRSMLVRRADMLPIECIVRGYVTGSAWKEYRTSGTIHGMPAPAGLVESDQLPEPIFTPSSKAEVGEHDENITFDDAAARVGRDVAEAARALSLEVYAKGAALAAERGIIIADTKFEFGWIDGALSICDEILTPDSSRFWAAESWKPGSTPPSFDKQPVRDWLESTGWDKSPPPPSLPTDVQQATRERYVEAYERITGLAFSDWYGVGEEGVTG